MPELGRGMLFPRSYFADQFTPAQEEAMEAAQAAAEDAPSLCEREGHEWIEAATFRACACCDAEERIEEAA